MSRKTMIAITIPAIAPPDSPEDFTASRGEVGWNEG